MLKNKKLFGKMGALIIATVMLIGVMPVKAAYVREFDVWDGSVTANWYSQSTNYRGATLNINSAADFIAFRNAVWQGTDYPAWGGGPYYTFWQATINLNCDIDLNNINLKYGIGGYNSYSSFRGTFNGNGHIIKNIKINPNLPDGANVQPTANIKDGYEAVSNKQYFGLFGQIIGDNDNGALNGGRIVNLHIEDIEITLPQEATDNSTVYAGGMAGWIINQGEIHSSSVKNVSFKGGPTTPYAGKRYIIGGMAGAYNTGTIKNSYVNGVDFTGLDAGYQCSWTYKAGLANVESTLRFLNIYSANVEYNQVPYEYNDQPYIYSTIYYDSLLNPVGSPTFTAAASNGKAFAEAPKRITPNGSGINETSSITLYSGYNVETLTHTEHFAGDGDKWYMVDLEDFNGEYPAAGSERLLLGRNAKLTAGGSEIASISDAGANPVSAQFEIMNSTREAQDVDIIIAGYKDGELAKVVYETVNVPATAGVQTWNQADGLGYLLMGRVNGYNIVSTTVSLDNPSQYDSIKAFCWNKISGLDGMVSLSHFVEKN